MLTNFTFSKNKSSSNMGFSLIELLAVIVILLVIVLVSTPSIRRMLKEGNNVKDEAIIERVIDGAKEYATVYTKGLLTTLKNVNDKVYISVKNLEKLGLIKDEDLKSLDSGAVVAVTLKENSHVEYELEYNSAIEIEELPFVMLLGDNPAYVTMGEYKEPGYVAFDIDGNNVTNRVKVEGTVNSKVLGEYEITYTLDMYEDNIKVVKRKVLVVDTIVPAVTTAIMTSNNSNNKMSKNGNIITVNMTFSKNVTQPKVVIASRDATVTGSGSSYVASITIPSNESTLNEGNLSLNISNYKDVWENKGIIQGNVTSGGLVLYDRTNPTCSSSGGSTSWINTSRTLTGTCSDTLSGCTGNKSRIVSTEINSTTEGPGVVYDNAGNSVTCPANQVVKIDKTKPTCSSSGGSTAWTNGSRTLSGTCSDGLSGCAGNATRTLSSDINSTAEGPGTVSDNAGNSVTCPANQTVRIDKTSPTCSIAKSNTGTTSGVTATVTGSDSGSGIASGNGTFTGLKSNKTYTVTDNVGNTGSCTITVTAQTQYRSASCATYNNGACTQYKSCPNSSCTCATYKSCANSACGAASCPNSSCSCAWWGNYVESKTYPSSCSASGSAGPNQVYVTCNVNNYVCKCKCGASSTSWTTTSSYSGCPAKCDSNKSKCPGLAVTGTLGAVNQYIKRTYTGSCTSYNSCANASACGYNSCRTSGCGCQTYNSCRAETCGCETYSQGSCASWNSFGSWTTTSCTASGTLKCENRTVYN